MENISGNVKLYKMVQKFLEHFIFNLIPTGLKMPSVGRQLGPPRPMSGGASLLGGRIGVGEESNSSTPGRCTPLTYIYLRICALLKTQVLEPPLVHLVLVLVCHS